MNDSTQRTILVTGGAGHVGSHVIEQLLEESPGDLVISLDNYFTGRLENHIEGAEYRRGHTKDIARLVPEHVDLVFHLGEYARIATSFEEPDIVFEQNTVGTFYVVEFCRQRKCKLVYAASSTKFADQGTGRNQNPYSFTKAVNVDMINNYGRWYDLDYAICYFYNAYGPRELGTGKYSTVIAVFQELYLQGKPLTVTKPGTQARNFTYVGDLARGIIAVAKHGKGDGYALNNPTSHTVLDIARAFGGEIVMADGYPGRSGSSDNPERARAELGWDTTIDLLEWIADFKAANPRP